MRKLHLSTLLLLGLPFAVLAADGAPAAAADGSVAKPVAIKIPGVEGDQVFSTPVPDVYEVRRNADIVYVTRDGKYVFNGDLYRVANQDNVTEVHRREIRKRLLDAVPESDMLVFGPDKAAYTVTVFTDVDCQYCRALHRQIADYNKLGIRVRYLFFPRTGPNTQSWFKAEQVWCSADRKAALTQAKLGAALPVKRCDNNPVAKEYALGKAVGLEGTPGFVAADGSMVGGYLPPDALLEQLKQIKPAG